MNKKVLGISLIIAGVGCITAGAFCLKPSASSKADSPAPSATTITADATTSATEQITAPATETATQPATQPQTPAKAQDAEEADNHAKGQAFEQYVVSRFGKKYWSINEWRSDKGVDGRYAESNMNPDLEMKLKLKDGEHLVAIECKWRKSVPANGKVKWSYPEQIKRYNAYSQSKGIPVFVAIGLGGTPSAPAHLYMVPLSALKEPQVGMSTLAQYEMKSDRQFFYDAAKQDFKRN